MEQQEVTSKQYFKTLSAVYYILIVGQGLWTVIAFASQYVTAERIITSHKTQGMFTILISFLAVSGFFVSKFLYNNSLRKISANANLKQRMHCYKPALIGKQILLSFVSLCAAMAAFLTGENIFLVFSLIIILLFFMDKPSAVRAARDLTLSPEDSLRVQNPDEIIA
ncbi:MAG: hypothetical protein LBH82_03485 [Bacteroidales bacterium]|jgi:hypothetical protein|nr:hypothetical protein [Bacteroidales bacterium]